MEDQSNPGNGRPDYPLSDEERRERLQSAMWWSARTIWGWKRFIVLSTGAVAVLAIVVTFLMPDWYQATTRVLLPESGSRGGLTAMLGGDLGPVASSLLGGSAKGSYVRYLAILESRRLLETAVDEFDLINIYELGDRPDALERAVRALRKNVELKLDRRLDYLQISVLDRDPERAAVIANFLVEELNRVNAELASQNAANYRRFVEQRYFKTVADLDSARALQQQFQEQHGVVELPTQVEAFMGSLVELRAKAIQAEIEANALMEQYGPENPRVAAARNAARSANAALHQLYEGSDRLMPVALSNMPRLAREYTEVMQEVLIQQEILKFTRPLYEQALFDEQRESIAVQVLDVAKPPIRKAVPKRMVLVVTAALSAMLVTMAFALAFTYVSVRYRSPATNPLYPSRKRISHHEPTRQ